ncbi:hypothetical protein ILUMI_10102 [Ignelater luminosus]|uniref:Uncharacterized protein n=1 Tax=Ignelater luminosus TaxID=2038154 RepID=A0A8K0D2X7_IGNLU|nr:hypothetical protein ILUMI_10102 [Ignelater luminosus]
MGHPPPRNVNSPSGFSLEVIREHEDIRNAAKLVAFKLGIDKPLHLHLALSDFEEETIMDVINEVLKHRSNRIQKRNENSVGIELRKVTLTNDEDAKVNGRKKKNTQQIPL